MYCEKCGENVEINTKFCGSCGEALVSNSTNEDTIRQSDDLMKKKKSKIWLIPVSLLLVGIIGAVLYFTIDIPIFANDVNKIIEALKNQDFIEAASIFDDRIDESDRDKLEDELAVRLDDLKDEFIEEEIEFNVAMMELNTIKGWHFSELEKKISELEEYINNLNESRISFELAESLYSSGDYPSAIEKYKQVSMEDKNYEQALEGVSNAIKGYKYLVLEESAALAEANDFFVAAENLESAMEIIGSDAEIILIRDTYISQGIEIRISEAKALTDKNDFTQALLILNDKIKRFPDNNSLINAVDGTKTKEKNHFIEQAKVLADEKRYDEAIALLKGTVYASSSDVLALIDDYTSKRPIILGIDIFPYQTENIVMFSEIDPEDIMGAQYIYGFRTDGWSSRNTAYINLDSKYTHISGIYGAISNSRDEGFSTFNIWGDGTMLASYELHTGDAAKIFSLDITGVIQLLFEFTDTSYDRRFGVANVIISPEEYVSALLNEPIGLYHNNAVLGKDIKAYRLFNANELSRENPEKLMGVDYTDGFVSSSGWSGTQSNVYYNINGQYNSLEGVYGPLDGISSNATGTIRFIADGNELASFKVDAGDIAQQFILDVTGVTHLYISITQNSRWNIDARFCVVNMMLS